MSQDVFTVGDLARHFGCKDWQVRRIFERGFLPNPNRAGLYRIVAAADVPKVRAALVRAGYLREPVLAH